MLENTTLHEVFRMLFFRPAGRLVAATARRGEMDRLQNLDSRHLGSRSPFRGRSLARSAAGDGCWSDGQEDSAYGRAYRDTAYLTHNSCGPSSGVEKLLALFYLLAAGGQGMGRSDARAWRESLMLRRIGFSEEEVSAYKREAEEAEIST